jgi:Uma2 family endonuclease
MTMTPSELKGLGITLPPTQNELPYDDGEPMESQRHKMQMDILIEALYPWLNAREDGYVGGNMFVYYGLSQVRNRDFRGPDFFAVLGVPKGERKSWVCWEEEKTPDVIIELLSESTAEVDKGEKKLIYQNQMHVPEYFWYDPFNPQDLAGFQLQGRTYQPIPLDEQGRLVSQVLALALVRWQGTYLGVEATWLRWTTLDGMLLPTGSEIAEQERQRAEQAHQRAEQERQRAEQERQRAEQAETQVIQIVQNLLRSNIATAQVAQMTGLTIAQVEQIGRGE